MECTWCLGLFFAALDLGEEDWHSIEARDLEGGHTQSTRQPMWRAQGLQNTCINTNRKGRKRTTTGRGF